MFKKLTNNYLKQFYDFLDSSKSGPIGNGRIVLKNLSLEELLEYSQCSINEEERLAIKKEAITRFSRDLNISNILQIQIKVPYPFKGYIRELAIEFLYDALSIENFQNRLETSKNVHQKELLNDLITKAEQEKELVNI